MLKISEHFEYYEKEHQQIFERVAGWESYYQDVKVNHKIVFDPEASKECVSLTLVNENGTHQCSISSSYYIGLDRFPKLDLPVYIEPKINNEYNQLNYVEMLFEALKEPKNFDHLEGLVNVHFENDWIEIENEIQPTLTPFLIAQFLATVKLLVKKGLKKSYYEKTENLNSKVKGKVLVGRQIKENILKNRFTHTLCKYQEFGFDTEVNQFIKYILSILPRHFEDFNASHNIRLNLEELLRYCRAGFQQVSQQTFTKLTYKENNPFYRQYNLAIKLGNQILALQDYNISRNSKNGTCKHPPFWIDMSKLFELYVFKKLRSKFTGEGEVVYHQEYHKHQLDFIINTDKIKAVVDAKYKPRYANGNPSMDDARQLSGYTRLNKVYEDLKLNEDVVIPAYFVYPSNLPVITEVENTEDIFVPIEFSLPERLLDEPCRRSIMYKLMYLQEISLPVA